MGGEERTAMSVSIQSLPQGAGTGLRVVDGIERRQCDLLAAGAVDPESADPGTFPVPLDAAARIETDQLVLPGAATYVREPAGTLVCELDRSEERRLPAGKYDVEVHAPIKLYVRVEGPCTLEMDAMTTTVSLSAPRSVLVGARSYHERPAATITTTTDEEDVMRAVSLLGSALKTTSPERSYPTLRGHPPAIELGDRFDVPEGIDRPDTGVRIEVPRTYASAFVVAPLAYYLGADVVPGVRPRIVTDAGFSYDLFADGFERSVARVLKGTFLLDCVVRTEGRYPVALHERGAVEDALDFDLSVAYDAPLAERLEMYLSTPYEEIEEHVPEWKLTTYVEPVASSVETIPFLVDDLAVVRSPAGRSVTRSEVQTEALREFMREGTVRSVRSTTRSDSDPPLVRPDRTDSLGQAWLGEDAPLGANKVSQAAFRNRLAREVTDGEVDITVVCNDEAMLEEHEDVSEVYRSRDDLTFDVTVHEGLTTDRLGLVLESDIDFLHYIGHIEDGGFNCPDGLLDAADIETVGVDAFFLNACRSYRQGMALIEAGAVGGVVTLDEVINSGAVTVGRTVARLLNRGFPLRAALDIARDRSVVGAQYLVLGDGDVDIAHSKGLVPAISEIEPRGDEYEVTIRTYASDEAGMGTMFKPAIGNAKQYLIPGVIDTFRLDEETFRSFLGFENSPVIYDGEFRWTEEIV